MQLCASAGGDYRGGSVSGSDPDAEDPLPLSSAGPEGKSWGFRDGEGGIPPLSRNHHIYLLLYVWFVYEAGCVELSVCQLRGNPSFVSKEAQSEL